MRRSLALPWRRQFGERHELRAFTGRCVLVACLLLPLVHTTPVWGQGAAVSGHVRDTLGLAIAGAEVGVDGSEQRAISGEDGSYALHGLAVGSARLRIRRLGFRPTVMDLEVPAGGLTDVEIQLVQVVTLLAPIAVLARSDAFESRLAGFYERRDRKIGHFISRERIERTHSFSFTDLLREVPGVRIRPIGSIQKAVRIRGSPCAPLVFLDGMPATAAEFDLESIDPGMVEGIEVYSGSATVPAEFAGPRNLDRCGVVAIWSSPFRSRKRTPDPAAVVDARAAVDLEGLVRRGEAFTASQVDTAVALPDGALAPEYPIPLYRERRSGRVLAEFVVDTTGAVVPETLGVVASTHPLFSLSARQALVQARFLPARRRGVSVPQVVQLPIEFIYPRPR
ncbi:MAG: TonB family protein [Gemmatimonadaceae bacterium]|nr:TonB family protein [Gemmatimonadaceae bacterium]